jgi:L-fucose isomerase-like protein
VRLGLCPIGKFVFSHEAALDYKRRLMDLLRRKGGDFVDLEAVLPDGIVRDQQHVGPVVEHFRRERVDALFIPHCNFGTEGAAGMIAHQCGVPTLLWGPRDEAPLPDGTRRRDTLCGLLATSKVLHTLRVPFSYINNCRLEDAEFERGLHRFLRAARVAKTLRRMRVAHVGQRIDFFWSTIVSESDLLQRFGVEVLPVDMALFLRDLERRVSERAAEYEQELRRLEQWVDTSLCTDRRSLLFNFALRDAAVELVNRHELDGLCFQTFSSVPEVAGGFLSLGVSLLNDLGIPVGCESDLHGAVSSILLEAAAEDEDRSFLADVTVRHPERDDAVLLWHFEAPLSLRHPETGKIKIGRPWILQGLPPGFPHFRLKDGPLTLCRFDGDGAGGYRIGLGHGDTVAGPYTQEFYTWMRVDDWPRWERRLIRGPYIHHCSFVHRHCADVLEEATRFLPQLAAERFDIPATADGERA